MKPFILSVLFLAVAPSAAFSEIRTQTVEYRHGDAVLEGYLAYDDRFEGPRPGVLVVHEWTGIGDYVRSRAEQLAAMGYVAFAADIYGKGIRPEGPDEASAQASIYKKDRQLMRSRALAGLEVLKGHDLVDPDKLAAIGYCFGGTVVLEMARAGADVDGVVSFHGGLETPEPAKKGEVRSRVLVLHGADDPYVKPDEVTAFWSEMQQAGADWQMHAYGHAVHSFTKPASGDDPSDGVAYSAQADRDSWEAMQDFFSIIFA